MRRTVKHDLPTAGRGMRTKRREESGGRDAPPPPRTVSLYSRGACYKRAGARRRREWVGSERRQDEVGGWTGGWARWRAHL
jgi:hypothetical protein